MRLENKIALVTEASGGLGGGICPAGSRLCGGLSFQAG